MRTIQRIAGVAAAATLAMGLVASSATAQDELKLDQVGAALALPLIGFGNVTYLTVTNVGPDARNLHFNAIEGFGREGEWQVTDFDCPVTASETVLITFRSVGENAAVIGMECNFGGLNPVKTVSRVVTWHAGILFIANETHECKDGSCTTTSNDLFGDFVVVNPNQGNAYSAGAIPFQGNNPLADGASDRDYMFNNDEYSMFPATLASNFIAPGPNRTLGGIVGAELILFTLDARANVGSQAALDIVFFDDDETPTSAHYTFDCFDIVPLAEIDPNFLAPFLGSDAGHFYATVIDADQYSNVHDNKFGNGNNIRVVGVHGWLLQTLNAVAMEAECAAGNACAATAWSRTLAQGMLPQDLDGNDVPTFDGL